ncbi:hypothetical protein ACHAXA_007835 [Cyclostephanos tholiformis]|uniref:Uncharacterized protein n=1 Tax=Cyclostephanos tholiformis TaxID=382380 RepID=A0ABD3SC59_9STRA
MPSSLAAALAASKQGGPAASAPEAAVNNPETVKNHDEPQSRPSSLQQHNKKKFGLNLDERATATKGPREKIKKHNGNSNNDQKKDGGKINDPIRHEKTTPNVGNNNRYDDGVAKSNAMSGKKKGTNASTPANNDRIRTGQMVFLCDIRDGEDDDGECKEYAQDNDGRRTRSSKRRGRKRGAKAAIPNKVADNSTGKIVFLCDIPSSSDDSEGEEVGDIHDGYGNFVDDGRGDDVDNGQKFKREVDGISRNTGVMTNNRQKSIARSRGNGDRGKGGGRDRDDREPAQCNNLQRDVNKSSDDGGIPNAPANPGSMPTLWSRKAQSTNTNSGTGFRKQGGGARDDRGLAQGSNLRRDNCGPAQGNNLRRDSNKSSCDGGIPDRSMNRGSMPTPWSIKAQAVKQDSDSGFSKEGGSTRSGGSNPRSGNYTTPTRDKGNDRYIAEPLEYPSSMPSLWSARAEARSNNDTCDKTPQMQSRDNDARVGHHPRGTSSREHIPTSTIYSDPTHAPSNIIIESGNKKDLAKFSAVQLESTAIKGRWADEDSDDE